MNTAVQEQPVMAGLTPVVLPGGIGAFEGDVKAHLPYLCDRLERYYDLPVQVGVVYRLNPSAGMGYVKVRPQGASCALNYVFLNEQVGVKNTERLKEGQTVVFQKDSKEVVVTLHAYVKI